MIRRPRAYSTGKYRNLWITAVTLTYLSLNYLPDLGWWVSMSGFKSKEIMAPARLIREGDAAFGLPFFTRPITLLQHLSAGPFPG
jgi:hypothetical protein